MSNLFSNSLGSAFKIIALAVTTISGYNQLPAQELNPEIIQAVSLHLPSRVSIPQQMAYQFHLRTHQYVDILWNIYPDAPDSFAAKDKAKYVHLPTFTIKAIKHDLPGPVCNCPLSLNSRVIFVFGATKNGEIRAIVTEPNSSEQPGYDGLEDTVRNRTTLHLLLPEDPEITSLHLFTTDRVGVNWQLVELGTISLGERQ